MAYIAGETFSTDFPTTAGALDRMVADGDHDGLVMRLAMDHIVNPLYVQRVNVGGPASEDTTGSAWSADGDILPGAGAMWAGAPAPRWLPLPTRWTTRSTRPTACGRALPSPAIASVSPTGGMKCGIEFATRQPTRQGCDGSLWSSRAQLFCPTTISSLPLGAETRPAPDETFTVTVTDKELAIDFLAAVGRPLVNAIQVKQIVTVRVNTGSGAYRDGAGNWWGADRAFSAGGWGYIGSATGTYTTTRAIAGTTEDSLYQTERSGMTEYRFTVPSGVYLVTLKFSENVLAGAGLRVFDMAEGMPRITDFDILAAAGSARYTAVDRTFAVTVSDGILHLEFVAKVRKPKVGAILVQSR